MDVSPEHELSSVRCYTALGDITTLVRRTCRAKYRSKNRTGCYKSLSDMTSDDAGRCQSHQIASLERAVICGSFPYSFRFAAH